MGVQVHPEVPKSSESAHSWSSTSPVIQSDSSSTTNSVSSSGTAQKETFLIGAIHRGYRAWARLIARHAILTIVVCSVLSLLGGIKIVNTPNENDITGYSPYGARSRDEYGIFQEFFSQDGLGVSIFVLALAKDGGNVLREEYLNETIQVSNFIAENFTLLNRITGRPENYNEFCYSFCTINVPLLQYHNGLRIQTDLLKSNAPLNARIQVGYPITRIFDRRLNVQPHFYGIELADEQNSTSKASNSTSLSTLRRITNLLSAKMIALQYRAEHKGDWTVQDVKEYETRISDYFIKHYKSDRLKVLTLSTTFVENEVVRAGMSLLPFLLVGFAIMGIVSTLTTFLSAFYWEQVSIHKLSLALAACICPFMACGTALGLLFVCGIRFGSILCVTPFLVLAIGVDAAYLMIHAWQRVSKRAREHPVKGDSTAYRLGEVLIDTGPAILISALTNIFADVAGSFTGSPEISLLCYGNMACIFANFIYQITFYSAVMTLAGEFEMKAEQKRHKHSIEIGREEAGDPRESFHQKVKVAFHRLLEVYVDLLTNKLIAFGVIVLWIAYLVGSTYGIIGLEINLTPKKLFAHDSPLLEMDDMRVDYVIPHFMVATVFINKPGDITDPARLARLDNFVAELESLPGAWGPTSTMYFMRDFRDFANSSLEEDAEEEAEDGESPANTGMLNLNYLPAFIKWTEYDFWRGFIRYHKDNATKAVVLDKFFITTGFHGQQLKEWPQRAVLLHSWRQVVDKYSVEFNATVYHDDAVYLDLIDNMPADTWQSAVATLGTMALICGIFMADFFTVVVATAAITSIMAGVLGILSLTGTDLDPIMMSATVISIGFSVDIPAHVTYHYHSAGLHSDRKLTVADRLKYCLRSVGFPALQASLSTNLCVLSLLCVSIYMGQVFVKTMVLCVSLCVLHGLVLIPCLFALIHPLLDYCSYRLKSPPASRSPSKPSTSLQLDETPKVAS